MVDNYRSAKELYIEVSMIMCILEEDKLDSEYMESFAHGQMMKDPVYGPISYNCCLANAFKLELRHNLNISLIGMKRATRKEIAKHVIRQQS